MSNEPVEEATETKTIPCMHHHLVYSHEFKTVRCEDCQRVWRDEWERPINIMMQAPPQPMQYPNIPIIGGR